MFPPSNRLTSKSSITNATETPAAASPQFHPPPSHRQQPPLQKLPRGDLTIPLLPSKGSGWNQAVPAQTQHSSEAADLCTGVSTDPVILSSAGSQLASVLGTPLGSISYCLAGSFYPCTAFLELLSLSAAPSAAKTRAGERETSHVISPTNTALFYHCEEELLHTLQSSSPHVTSLIPNCGFNCLKDQVKNRGGTKLGGVLSPCYCHHLRHVF